MKPEEKVPLDGLDSAEKEEEYYLKHDSAAKFQFNYNRVTAFVNDNPEVHVQEPLILAPGEGSFLYIILMKFIYHSNYRENSN